MIRSMKFQTVRIPFVSDVFVCCHGSQIFSVEKNSVEENVCLKYDA